MENREIAYQIIIEGRVTGVGFRWAALDYAENCPELKGYIRNLSGNQVEAVIQGPPEQVELMLAWLRHGPRFARVDDVQVKSIPLRDWPEKFAIT